jgi:hypothetical protein
LALILDGVPELVQSLHEKLVRLHHPAHQRRVAAWTEENVSQFVGVRT